jgi:arylsulfatase A
VIEQQPDQSSLTQRYVEESVRFMRANKDRPFLVYFAHMYVHLPLYVPDRFVKESVNKYAASVACIDWAMGVLLYELRQLGLDKNTLVLFTSDNGSRCDYGRSNGPLRGTKGGTWEGGMRAPLVAWWPGVIPAGRVCREVAAGMDLLPTFATMAGTQAPTDRIIDGRDIGPLLRGEQGAASPHQALFYYQGPHLDAVRSGKWKLFVGRHRASAREEGIVELYDLEADSGEKVNLASSQPEVAARLTGLIEAMREDIGDGTVGAPGRNIRPIGRVANPRPLTRFDPDHPYFMAMYDLKEIG